MIINNEHSVKGMYKFVDMVLKIINNGIPYERTKKIVFNQFLVESKEEKECKDLKDAYIYLVNNNNQNFNLELLEKTYFILTSKVLTKNISSKIMETYYLNIDVSIVSLAALLHLLILDIVKDKKIEFAFLISYFLILRKMEKHLIISKNNFNNYYEIIKNNDIGSLKILFFFSYKSYLIKEEKETNLEEILFLLKDKRKKLIEDFRIKKLFLCGSFSKEFILNTSDIDLIVIFNDDLLNIEQEKLINEMKGYLNDFMPRKVDLLNFSNSLNSYNDSDLEKMNTII